MKLTKVFEGACKIANFRQLKLIVFVLAIMMSIGTFAQKEKIIKNFWHAKVWLKDGTTDSGYIRNGHKTVCVYDETVVLNNLDGLFSKSRTHATTDIDSMYIWFDTEPDEVLISHAVPVHYYYGNETPMEYGYPSMCYVLYQSKNVTIYEAWDLYLGDFYLYKTPDMQYAKALFRKGKKLTEKRRATLCDEFQNYSIIKNYIKSIHKDKLKDDPVSFFLLIDKVLGSEKKDRR